MLRKIKRKNVLLLFLVIFTVIALFYVYNTQKGDSKVLSTHSKATPTKPAEPTIEPLKLTQEELKQYYEVYKNPFVLYLRKSLDAYLADDSSNINISQVAVANDKREGIISGLASFDKEYYKSKFVVLTINDSIAGGKDIQILFQDKPDRIFYAWVYDLAGGNYELRGFNSKENFPSDAMEEIIKLYEPYIKDKEHAL